MVAGQLLKQVQTKEPQAYDQSTILFVYYRLLKELDADSTMDPDWDQGRGLT